VSDTALLATVKTVIWNDLLTYVFHYRNTSNVSAITDILLKHFSDEDIADAKRLLVGLHEFQAVPGSAQFLPERRNSNTRSAKAAECDDILGILLAADADSKLEGFLFVACDIKLLPKFGPEEMNIAVVVDRQVQMETSIKELTTAIQQISTPTVSGKTDEAIQQAADVMSKEMLQHLTDFNAATSARLDQLNSVCCQLVQNVETVSSNFNLHPPLPSRSPQAADDRALNLVLYGVPENQSAAVWRKTVDDALRHVTGHDVDLVDLHRVGRFTTGKVRPVIAKLRTTWDKRLILSNCRMLKYFEHAKIFVAADEPLEVRRQRALIHIKNRAERDGKEVVLFDGILSVNGIQVFSLSDGRLS
jgi:hypothetical protein